VLVKGLEEEVKLDQKYQPALTPEQDIAARYRVRAKGLKEEVKLDQNYEPALTPEQDIAARY
jgi:hypothetical protein